MTDVENSQNPNPPDMVVDNSDRDLFKIVESASTSNIHDQENDMFATPQSNNKINNLIESSESLHLQTKEHVDEMNSLQNSVLEKTTIARELYKKELEETRGAIRPENDPFWTERNHIFDGKIQTPKIYAHIQSRLFNYTKRDKVLTSPTSEVSPTPKVITSKIMKSRKSLSHNSPDSYQHTPIDGRLSPDIVQFDTTNGNKPKTLSIVSSSVSSIHPIKKKISVANKTTAARVMDKIILSEKNEQHSYQQQIHNNNSSSQKTNNNNYISNSNKEIIPKENSFKRDIDGSLILGGIVFDEGQGELEDNLTPREAEGKDEIPIAPNSKYANVQSR